MFIYNITFGFDKSLEKQFIGWLKYEFIPTSTEDNEYFSSPELFYVRTQQDPGVNTVALHMRANSKADIDNWYSDHGSRLFDSIMKQWNGSVVFFATTLEAVE